MPTKKTATPELKTLKFEDALQELDTLVNTLEDGDISLEESLAAFEKGVKLTKTCQQHLSDAEQTVSLLVEQEGELSLKDGSELTQQHSANTP